jgi:hypothetical protein
MMSHTGWATPVGDVPAPDRSARLVPAAADLLFTFMSAMLTYFGFMLQKHRYGRKDRAEIRISRLLLVSRMLSVPVGQLIPGVARGRKVLE